MQEALRTTRLPAGIEVPSLGLGTWKMGEDSRRRKGEASALRLGLDLGMTLIDTAEMYGSGGAEEVVRDAITGRRDTVFLVSKVLPSSSSRSGTIRACEASLKRLGTDRIDLYLLHWRGSVPLMETIDAFEKLKTDGKIRHWGVSNFDTDDMEELAGLKGGEAVQANQVLYNVERRGIEFDLLPASRQTELPVMAYSPVGQGDLAKDATLAGIGRRHGATAAQIALAWVLRQKDVIAVPKAVRPQHIRENRAALDIVLTPDDLAEIDLRFPPVRRKRPLEMI